MGRKLASLQRIKDITPIEGADKIEVAHIQGWKVVVAKDVGHKVGDLVVYCEIDSFLPIRDEFEFLRKSSYKKMGDQEGFRLKTIKLRGTVSQGLILPFQIFSSYGYRISEDILITDEFPKGTTCLEPDRVVVSPDELIPIGEGVDVTEVLGIQKYEAPIPAQLAGKVKGSFPSFIKKTDEERIQNIDIDDIRGDTYFLSEKLDGTSDTVYFNIDTFGVCSRNLELARPEGEFVAEEIICDDGVTRLTQENTYWKVARECGLEEILTNMDGNFAIQGEIIGEGIQKNRYGLKGQKLFVFNIFDIDKFEYLTQDKTIEICDKFEIATVPMLGTFTVTNETVDDLLKMAEGKSVLNPNVEREGLVWRSTTRDFSFKTISNKFLLKGGE